MCCFYSHAKVCPIGRVDTLDPRAGGKCGKYSNRSNGSDAVRQVKNRSKAT
jgi:hypothetical protein